MMDISTVRSRRLRTPEEKLVYSSCGKHAVRLLKIMKQIRRTPSDTMAEARSKTPTHTSKGHKVTNRVLFLAITPHPLGQFVPQSFQKRRPNFQRNNAARDNASPLAHFSSTFWFTSSRYSLGKVRPE